MSKDEINTLHNKLNELYNYIKLEFNKVNENFNVLHTKINVLENKKQIIQDKIDNTGESKKNNKLNMKIPNKKQFDYKNDKNKFKINNIKLLNLININDNEYLFSRYEFKLKLLELINYSHTNKLLINEHIISNMNIKEIINKNKIKIDEVMSYNEFENFINILIDNFSK